MARKIVTKSDIPQYAQKKIPNFKKLTKNQAIYEYELLKLKRRAGKDFGSYLSGYFERAGRITKKAIEAISSLKGKKLEKEKETYETEQRINRLQRRDEREDRSFSLDLNEEIQKEKEYSSSKQYLKETGQAIDPFTGEVISVADEKQLAREFFDRVISEIQNESAQAQVSYSSYKSGRSRSAKSRQWVSDNIERGTNKLINLINSRRINEETELAFYKSLKANGLNQLQDAISEYIAGLYYQTAETLTGYMQASRVYQIISDVPISMADARGFDNSGDNSEEEEIDEE